LNFRYSKHQKRHLHHSFEIDSANKRHQMITDIFTPIDEDCDRSLKDIQSLLDSESFLAGLGNHCHKHTIPNYFKVITDFDRSQYLLLSQEMWDTPTSDRVDQYFTEILDDAVSFTGNSLYDRNEAKRRKSFFRNRDKIKQQGIVVSEKIEDSYKQNNISEFLLNEFSTKKKEHLNEFINSHLKNFTSSCFHVFIRGAYFGGLQNWPVAEHLFQSYLVGGFPTGWVGPLPKNGGKSRECMQLLHFGSHIQ